jgi:lipopolysaccharide transport system permease protein
MDQVAICAGLLTWNYFSEAVNRGQNVFLENANLLKKINFPRMCLPIIALTNALVNFVIIFALFTVFLLVTGAFPGKIFLALIPVLAIQVLLSAGLGLTLGVLNVFFRDVGQLSAIVLQFWFWATPVVYPINILPPFFQQLIRYNPMTNLMGVIRYMCISGITFVFDLLS